MKLKFFYFVMRPTSVRLRVDLLVVLRNQKFKYSFEFPFYELIISHKYIKTAKAEEDSSSAYLSLNLFCSNFY